MPDRILITTADLEPAVRLRHAFDESDFQVELLTPGEHITDVQDPCLLILTGGLQEKAARRLTNARQYLRRTCPPAPRRSA